MKHVKRKANEENFLPEEIIKIDPDENPDNAKVEKVVLRQNKREKHLFPLCIDSRTVIYVPKHLHNDSFKKEWMESRGLTSTQLNNTRQKEQKGVTKKVNVELINSIRNLLQEGYSPIEIAHKLLLSKSKVYSLMTACKLHSLKPYDRARALAKKGVDREEICARLNIKMSTLEKYCIDLC